MEQKATPSNTSAQNVGPQGPPPAYEQHQNYVPQYQPHSTAYPHAHPQVVTGRQFHN